MSSLTNKPTTYKVANIAFTNGSGRSFVPTISFSGGGGGTGAAATFNSTYVPAYTYNTYSSYVDSLNEAINYNNQGIYPTTASGNITTTTGVVAGTYTTATVSEWTGGGIILDTVIASGGGGSGYRYPTTNQLINGTLSNIQIFINNDPTGGIEAYINVVFTNGVATSMAGGATQSFPNTSNTTGFTLYPVNLPGYIQSADTYATFNFTRTAKTFTNYYKVNSTTVTNGYAWGYLPGYTHYFYYAGWPQAIVGSGSAKAGVSNTFTINSGVTSSIYATDPAYYNLNSITINNAGTRYTIPPTVSVNVNVSPFIVLTPTMTLEV